MKKYVTWALILMIICASTLVQAQYTDVSQDAVYADAANRLGSLGIMGGVGTGTFQPQNMVTREEFAVMMVKAAGLEDEAEAAKGSTVFSDVSASSSTSGYIAEALEKGYISGMPDGKFHPKEKITYAHVCTVVVKVLGYSNEDLSGLWPKNYMEKASKLGLTDKISLKSSDGVPRWAMALILDRLLDTPVKKTNAADNATSFAETVGLFTQCIILADSTTSGKLQDNQVLTDKGTLYLSNSAIKLQPGNTYRLNIKGDAIKASYESGVTVENISVDSVVDNKIAYKVDGEVRYKVLPDKTVYYYQGVKQSYENLKNIIQTRSSIVLTMNQDQYGYEYGVIFDPIYSNPEVARNFQPSSKRLGSIKLSGNLTVIREGSLADILQIQEKDVVYSISDIWGGNRYILALDNRVGGKITAILPDKISPRTMEIDGVSYDFSENVDLTKLNHTPGSFQVDDNVVALLGYDGKIVDLEYPGSETNSSFALVLNASSKITTNTNGTLTYIYYARIMTSDGITVTYDVGTNASQYKGKLVQFTKIDNQKAEIEAVPYNFPQQVTINKLDRFINDSYAADNMKIFNIISDGDGADVQASLLDFKDLPEGAVADGKVYFANKTGVFEDVNLLVTKDILNEKYKTGVIKSMTASKGQNGVYTYGYTILVDGREYSYRDNYINNSDIGAIMSVEMTAEGIGTVIDAQKPDVTSTSVQAFDARRIKINDKVLWFNQDISVYFLDYAGNVTVKSVADLSVNLLYGSVSVYLDQSADQGGKVDAIVVKQ